MKRLNARRLSRIIKNVEASLETQELSLTAEEKAQLIVDLYRASGQGGPHTEPYDHRSAGLVGLDS